MSDIPYYQFDQIAIKVEVNGRIVVASDVVHKSLPLEVRLRCLQHLALEVERKLREEYPSG